MTAGATVVPACDSIVTVGASSRMVSPALPLHILYQLPGFLVTLVYLNRFAVCCRFLPSFHANLCRTIPIVSVFLSFVGFVHLTGRNARKEEDNSFCVKVLPQV